MPDDQFAELCPCAGWTEGENVGLTQPHDLPANNRLEGSITSNFLINEVDAMVYRADGTLASQSRQYPEDKHCLLSSVPFDPDITTLPAGRYRFVLTLKIGYGDYVHADYPFQK